MQIKSWHLASAGFSIYMIMCFFYLINNSLQDCALVGDCINCGNPTVFDCIFGSFVSDFVYILSMTLITLVPMLLLKAQRTRKIGAISNISLGSLMVYAAISEGTWDIEAMVFLIPSMLFIIAGFFFYLKEKKPLSGPATQK